MPKRNWSGTKFGRWTVLSFLYKKGSNSYWLCRCSCGAIRPVQINNLTSGKTKSCGCLKVELQTIHGDTRRGEKVRLYRIWRHILSRCQDKNNHEYHRYGGRGITVCEEWKIYKIFKNWALMHGYDDTLTIDRINNDGNYEPSNCRWITRGHNSSRSNRGEGHGNSKLTNVIVEEAKILRRQGFSLKQIADNYGVCSTTIGRAITGKSWRHIK